MLVPVSMWAAGFVPLRQSVVMGMSTANAMLPTSATSFFVFMPAPLLGLHLAAVMLKEAFSQNFPNAVVAHGQSGWRGTRLPSQVRNIQGQAPACTAPGGHGDPVRPGRRERPPRSLDKLCRLVNTGTGAALQATLSMRHPAQRGRLWETALLGRRRKKPVLWAEHQGVQPRHRPEL
jgi:hypothetical protein